MAFPSPSSAALIPKATASIARALTRDMVLLAVVPLALVMGLLVWFATRSLETSSRQRLTLLSEVTATRLDELLAANLQLADTVARSAEVVAALKANDASSAASFTSSRFLKGALLANPDLNHLSIINPSGVGIVGTDPDDVGLDLSFRAYVQDALAGRKHISGIIVGKTTLRPGIFFSVPVRDCPPDAGEVQRATSRVIGLVVLKLKGERLQEIIKQASIGEAGYTMLVDEHAVVLADPSSTRIFSSLRPLSADVITNINPQATLQRASVPSLGFEELADVVLPQGDQASDALRSGAAIVSLAKPSPDSTATDASSEVLPWAAGFTAMINKPWRVIAIEPRSQFAAAILDLRRVVFMGIAVAALAAIAVAIWRAGRLVRPAQELVIAADKIIAGDTQARATKVSDDEIGHLADVFNAVVPRLQEHAFLQKSLAVAVEVQNSLLPSAPPKVQGLDLAGASLYCDATGGDYFDYFVTKKLDNESVFLAVADVMGHGVGSALLMAATRAALHAEVDDSKSLPEILERVNRVLCKDARHNKFVTLALLVLNVKTRAVRWASAGHDPAVILNPATGEFFELEGGGVPLGVFDDATYEEFSHPGLPEHAILTLGSDGIWEAGDPSKELFGKDRWKEVIKTHQRESAKEIGDHIAQAVREFRHGEPQQDDVTFIVAKLL